MISVIIPLYNQARHLPGTLDSLLEQTYRDFEIIVVNDGSSDNSGAAAKSFSNRFLALSVNYKIVNHEANMGAPAARNRGAQEARGAYLLFCDADVRLDKDMLAIMLSALESHPEAGFAYSSFKWGRKLFKLFPYDAGKLKSFPYINMMSLMRREDFPGFDKSLKKFQDWDLWLQMLKRGKEGVWIDRVLFEITPGGTMSHWLPSFAYKLFPMMPAVKRYKKALAVIKEKHGLK